MQNGSSQEGQFSQKVANGGVPVRVKDAAVARQRLLFPLGVWL